MTTKKPIDNSPAFPGVEGMNGYGNHVPVQMPSGDVQFVIHQPGMTLRDYLAAHAMQGILASGEDIPLHQIAKTAYEQADEMLIARDQ